MTELSMPWGGTSTGDASEAPYDDDEWSDLWALLHGYDRTTQGVIATAYSGAVGNLLASADLSTMLEVTSAAGPTIRVARGAALVDGKLYVNDSRIEDPDGGITAPGAGSNYYRVVLRKDFAAQTVRTALLGPNAAAPPAVTQTDGTTWEISLATIQITSGGVVTVTDTREFINSSPMFPERQGGNADDWDNDGTTNYIAGPSLIQTGQVPWSGAAADTGVVDVTFPVEFGGTPLVFATAHAQGLGGNMNVVVDYPGIGWPTTTEVRLRWYDIEETSSYTLVYINWFAIGPA
jgi:hypothetical protein